MCKEVKKVDDRNVIMEFLNTAFGDQKDKE